jgi:hypothetical protein
MSIVAKKEDNFNSCTNEGDEHITAHHVHQRLMYVHAVRVCGAMIRRAVISKFAINVRTQSIAMQHVKRNTGQSTRRSARGVWLNCMI